MLSLIVLNLLYIRTTISQLQRTTTVNAVTQPLNGVAIIPNPETTKISGTIYNTSVKSQNAYDVCISLDTAWSFKPTLPTTLIITLNGNTPNPTADSDLLIVFTVDNTHYFSFFIHLDTVTVRSRIFPFNKLAYQSDILSYLNDSITYPQRWDRVSEGDQWIQTKPRYNSQAQWPLQFHITNNITSNNILFSYYDQAQTYKTGNTFNDTFATNKPINIYIMGDTSKEQFQIYDINVQLHHTNIPTISPTNNPIIPITPTTNNPTLTPTINPSISPSLYPTHIPSLSPSLTPTGNPIQIPSISPSLNPTHIPSILPSLIPTGNPSITPTISPTTSNNPTEYPTLNPSISPSYFPTNIPTYTPTISPINNPSISPSNKPTLQPSITPTNIPTITPTYNPTPTPSSISSAPVTATPSITPTYNPSQSPSNIPTISPSINTINPTNIPTIEPTYIPTYYPTNEPIYMSTNSIESTDNILITEKTLPDIKYVQEGGTDTFDITSYVIIIIVFISVAICAVIVLLIVAKNNHKRNDNIKMTKDNTLQVIAMSPNEKSKSKSKNNKNERTNNHDSYEKVDTASPAFAPHPFPYNYQRPAMPYITHDIGHGSSVINDNIIMEDILEEDLEIEERNEVRAKQINLLYTGHGSTGTTITTGSTVNIPIINNKIKFEFERKSDEENNSEETTVSAEKNRFIHAAIGMQQMDGMYEETETKLTDLDIESEEEETKYTHYTTTDDRFVDRTMPNPFKKKSESNTNSHTNNYSPKYVKKFEVNNEYQRVTIKRHYNNSYNNSQSSGNKHYNQKISIKRHNNNNINRHRINTDSYIDEYNTINNNNPSDKNTNSSSDDSYHNRMQQYDYVENLQVLHEHSMNIKTVNNNKNNIDNVIKYVTTVKGKDENQLTNKSSLKTMAGDSEDYNGEY